MINVKVAGPFDTLKEANDRASLLGKEFISLTVYKSYEEGVGNLTLADSAYHYVIKK